MEEIPKILGAGMPRNAVQAPVRKFDITNLMPIALTLLTIPKEPFLIATHTNTQLTGKAQSK